MPRRAIVWTIVLVALAAIAAAIVVASRDRPTPPTALAARPEASSPVVFPVDPRSILDPRGPGDAGAIYRALADADPAPFDRVIRQHDLAADFTSLVAATHVKSSPIFTPAELVHYGDDARLDALARVGQAAVIAGMLKRDATLYDAAFSLGLRLAEERLTWREFAAGVQVMSSAGAAMGDRATPFLNAQRDATRDRWTPLFEAIDTRREPLIAQHNGDVFAIASSATADRMFRVEAILKLGRLRFNIGTPPRAVDQRRATQLLDGLAASATDDAIRRAVDVARGLTAEGFRTMR